MEVEARIVKQYKYATTVAVANITGERGWRMGKKVSLRRFLADQKIASSWKKCVLGHPIARATQTHSDYGPSKMHLKLAV